MQKPATRIHCEDGASLHLRLQDPSGYLWEVLPASGEDEPVREMNILVSRLEESVKFYRDLLGMQVARRETAEGEEGYERVSPASSQCRASHALT